jgi:hypothetical protein
VCVNICVERSSVIHAALAILTYETIACPQVMMTFSSHRKCVERRATEKIALPTCMVQSIAECLG